jgi:hypothetical protein
MPISLDHEAVKLHLDRTARELGLRMRTEQHEEIDPNIRVTHARTMDVLLPEPALVRATFTHERLIDHVKKLFVHHPFEVGTTVFDARIHVVTSTPAATRTLLESARVQEALLLLVTHSRRVEIGEYLVRVIDQDAEEPLADVAAELIALAAHLKQGAAHA